MRYLKYIIILFFILSFGLLLTSKEKESKVISFNNNYHQLIFDKEVIRIPLLSNDDSLPILNQELISKVSLTSSSNQIPCSLVNLKKEDYLINYVDDNYYSYMFDLNLDVTPNFNLEDVNLNLELIDGTNYEFRIGNLDVTKGDLNSFYVNYLDSRSSEIKEYYTVKEVVIGLEGIKDFNLDKISLNSRKVGIDNTKIKVFNNLEEVMAYQEKTPLDELIYEKISSANLDLKIKKGEIKYLVIPLTYFDKTYLNRFYLEFLIDGKKEYLDDNLYLNQGFYPSFMFIEGNFYDFSKTSESI